MKTIVLFVYYDNGSGWEDPALYSDWKEIKDGGVFYIRGKRITDL
jgi:hypothetical protein